MADHPRDRLAAVNAANALSLLVTIVPATRRNKSLTLIGVAASMALTLVAWDLYADYYDRHAKNPVTG